MARFAIQVAMHQQRTGQRIALWRERAGLSQEEAAAAAGLSLRGWQRAEYGEVTPYPRNLEKIARAVGATVEDLRGDPPKSTDDVADQLDRIETKLDLLVTALRLLPTEDGATLEQAIGDLEQARHKPPRAVEDEARGPTDAG